MYSYVVVKRIPDWQDGLTINAAAVKVSPNSCRSHTFYVTGLYDNKYKLTKDKAEKEKRAVEDKQKDAKKKEDEAQAAQKAQAALAKGVTPIVCVGETLAEREAGQTEAVVKRQLSAVIHQLAHCAAEMVVAYEPVWAIGTGRTASPEQAQEVHAVLRAQLHAATGRGDSMKILYGGSVKADNAATLFAQPDIDGGLIGGASLKASDFIAICRAST